MYSYLALILVSVMSMIVLDEDPTNVSPVEWVLFAVMAYAALGFFRLYQERERERHR